MIVKATSTTVPPASTVAHRKPVSAPSTTPDHESQIAREVNPALLMVNMLANECLAVYAGVELGHFKQ